MQFLHRTWAEIDTAALVHNFKLIKKSAGNAALISVVKANAYGHGAKSVIETLLKCGTDGFAVSNIDEALEVREIDADVPVLVLGYTPVELAKKLSDNNIVQTVYSVGFARQLSDCANAAGVTVKFHLKFDTGMGRLGFDLRDDALVGLDDALLVLGLPNLELDGIFTHFAASDRDGDSDGSFTQAQYNRFCRGVEAVKAAGYSPRVCHCCNSAALLLDKEKHFDACRPGIILYGLSPAPQFMPCDDFIPVMTLKSIISFIKDIRAGDSVNYGRSYIAQAPMRVATIPIGYADGYPRLLSNRGYVIINGQRANIIGRVCMDQISVDITGLDNINEGNEVILFGRELSVDILAELCGTINYEIVCGITNRVPRILK